MGSFAKLSVPLVYMKIPTPIDANHVKLHARAAEQAHLTATLVTFPAKSSSIKKISQPSVRPLVAMDGPFQLQTAISYAESVMIIAKRVLESSTIASRVTRANLNSC